MALEPNNREEFFLKGMVDGSTDLTPNKRREYWYKEIIDAIGSGGGGGGGTGGGVLVATATTDMQEMKMTLDKSFNDVASASFTVVKMEDPMEANKVYFMFLIGTQSSNVSYAINVAQTMTNGTIQVVQFSAEDPDAPLEFYMG